jgi:serine/threonine protein kinase
VGRILSKDLARGWLQLGARRTPSRALAANDGIELLHGLSPFPRRFRKLRRLGEGSQGIVYLCQDLAPAGGLVAVKVARSTAAATAALRRETRALWALRHLKGVPRLRALIYRRGRLGGFVTSYFPGETLDSFLKRGVLDAPSLLTLSLSLGDAALGILGAGYLHRDLKPQNVLVAPDLSVQILDFGLVARLESGADEGDISGTLTYASPEQLQSRRLTSKSDLFSLGVILYEAATGRPFFAVARDFNKFLAARSARLRGPVGVNGIDGELAALIERLLVEDPALRADFREVRSRMTRIRSQLRVRRAG